MRPAQAAAVSDEAPRAESPQATWSPGLVGKLDELADRYEPAPDETVSADRAARIALLRATAERGRAAMALEAAGPTTGPALAQARWDPMLSAVVDVSEGPANRMPPAPRGAGLMDRIERDKIVQQAQGLLMVRHGVTAAQAHEILVVAAQTKRTTMFEVASREVIRHSIDLDAKGAVEHVAPGGLRPPEPPHVLPSG